MYLIDTNIFLEILLAQEKHEVCKQFLDKNNGNFCISDFSLHSIGVILFKNAKEDIFQKFVIDVIGNTEIISCQKDMYEELAKTKKDFGLDFDDAYQYNIAKEQELEIVTMDKDFKRVKEIIKIMFL